ncbi:Mitochondrial substrate/solute carrier [Trinorchestia longiramus]|nr:Mitochondrial substrate/solute carrier [Trinorchestia longiramus]
MAVGKSKKTGSRSMIECRTCKMWVDLESCKGLTEMSQRERSKLVFDCWKCMVDKRTKMAKVNMKKEEEIKRLKVEVVFLKRELENGRKLKGGEEVRSKRRVDGDGNDTIRHGIKGRYKDPSQALALKYCHTMLSSVGYNSSSSNLSAGEVGAAGGISGFITRMLAQPLDVLKIRFQLQLEPTRKGGGGHYYGLLQAMGRIVREEGVRALWKGHVAAQALTVLYGVGQFWSYNLFTKYLMNLGVPDKPATQVPPSKEVRSNTEQNSEKLSSSAISLCGSAAAVCGTLISMPCDVARTRIVAQSTMKYRSLVDVLQQMTLQEGVRSLWRGLLPTLGTSVPNAAIQFPVYTALMNSSQGFDSTLGLAWRSAVSGSMAGLVAKLIVYPLDLLKKRSQMRGAEHLRQNLGKVVLYRSIGDMAMRITSDEGIQGWYKGLWPALVKSSVVSGLSFVTFEMVCQFILYSHSFRSRSEGGG